MLLRIFFGESGSAGDSVWGDKVLYKLSRRLSKCESVFIGVLLLAMSALAFTQVITRYVFFYSIVWLEELTRYLMIWMTFFGAAMAVEKQDHINIDILPGIFKKHSIDFYPFINLLIFIFSCISVYYAWLLVSNTAAMGQTTDAMRIPMALVYSGMLVSYLLMAFHSGVRILMAVTGKDKKEGN